jgi:hypothetical protein
MRPLGDILDRHIGSKIKLMPLPPKVIRNGPEGSVEDDGEGMPDEQDDCGPDDTLRKPIESLPE